MRLEDYVQMGKELSDRQWAELAIEHPDALKKYMRLRDRHPSESIEWCFEATKAWAKNLEEQKQRRVDHGTGAV